MTAQPTVLHVPSLASAVTGDLAYKVHMMTAETVDPERAQCPRRRDLHSRAIDDPDLSRHMLTSSPSKNPAALPGPCGCSLASSAQTTQ
jgi:hypothetical protein